MKEKYAEVFAVTMIWVLKHEQFLKWGPGGGGGCYVGEVTFDNSISFLPEWTMHEGLTANEP